MYVLNEEKSGFTSHQMQKNHSTISEDLLSGLSSWNTNHEESELADERHGSISK